MWRQTLGVILFLYFTDAAFEGDSCNKGGVPGTCVNIRKCQAAIDDIQRRINPQICAFDGADPIVCCVSSPGATNTNTRPGATTTQRTTSTTEYVPPDYTYVDNDGGGKDGCVPIGPDRTSPKTGQKAWDKCVEYQEQLIYPCVKDMALTGDITRASRCSHNADELIVGGVDTARNEFPHMVLLGYGDAIDAASWSCGGSLVSERFVLTAGHCTSSRDGAVAFARIGALRRSDQIDISRVYRIRQIHKHGGYKSPLKYNDIALLETDRLITLDQFVVPACLHVGDPVKDDKALATGWGLLQNRGTKLGDNLQKVILTKFTEQECAFQYPVGMRNLEQGIKHDTQMCYGDRTQKKDTCQGDSGGPLQIKSKRIHCMYVLIGVTSFGKSCGYPGESGVYTKVAPYVSWIESIVWP